MAKSCNPEREILSGWFEKPGEVRGKTGMINLLTGNTGDKKAEKNLKWPH